MAEVAPDFKEGKKKCGPLFVTDTAGRDSMFTAMASVHLYFLSPFFCKNAVA